MVTSAIIARTVNKTALVTVVGDPHLDQGRLAEQHQLCV